MLRCGNQILWGKSCPVDESTVFAQLCDFAPDVARFTSNLGFILAEAEQCFLQTQQASDSNEWQHMLSANLGYVYLVQGNLNKAKECLHQAASLATDEDEAILRVAYWRDGQVQPDDVIHPSIFTPGRCPHSI